MTLRTLMAWPLLRLKMIRVGHGFTVHSPFAYHFIKTCLRESLPYYAFRHEVTTRAGRRLFRVAAYFNPATVRYVGESREARRIIGLACPRACETEDAEFIYVASGQDIPQNFRVLYAEDFQGIPSRSMTFSNGRTLISVRRGGLPAQVFRLKF